MPTLEWFNTYFIATGSLFSFLDEWCSIPSYSLLDKGDFDGNGVRGT